MCRRPELEVPDPVGADSAPLEMMQAELMVQCWLTMAPLEALQGHASAVARSRGNCWCCDGCWSRDFGGTLVSNFAKNSG